MTLGFVDGRRLEPGDGIPQKGSCPVSAYQAHRLLSGGPQVGIAGHRLEAECRFAGYYRHE